MDKITVFMKNQKGSSEYNAKAEYYGDKIVVLKGSKINSKVASSSTFKLNSFAQSAREDKNNYDKRFILTKDIEFSSPSTAGQFVCGYSVSGMTAWRDTNKRTLKEIVKGGK